MKTRGLAYFLVGLNLLGTFSFSDIASCEPASPMALPAGWQFPIGKQVDQEWRAEIDSRYLIAHGDFDGDGVQDVAFLLVRDRTSAPFVALTQKKGAPLFYQVEEASEIAILETEGLKLAKPGTYQTACGRGYVDCGPGEKESVTVSFDAIILFKNEGSSRLLYWDATKKKFTEVWLDD